MALVLCLMLGTGLRFVGLTRGISDFDPSGQSDHQTFYHFHPDEETLIRGALAFAGVLPGAALFWRVGRTLGDFLYRGGAGRGATGSFFHR